MKRLLISCAIGVPLGVVPIATLTKTIPDFLIPIMSVLAIPGVAISIALSGGNVHIFNLAIAAIANALLWSAIVYGILTYRQRKLARPASKSG